MGWYWNMGPSRSMKRAFMEQAAATGELHSGLVSGWRRRESPVRVGKRRGCPLQGSSLCRMQYNALA